MKKMRDGTMYEQREIVLIPFPYSDLTGTKQRPAMILSNKKLNKTEDRICCLITSNEHKDDLLIDKSSFEREKLPFQSWVRPHRLFTINVKIIRKVLCKVNDEFFNEVVNGVDRYIKRD